MKFSDGEEISYDKLLLATGSKLVLDPWSHSQAVWAGRGGGLGMRFNATQQPAFQELYVCVLSSHWCVLCISLHCLEWCGV